MALLLAALWLLMLMPGVPSQARAAEAEAVLESAVFLLEQTTRPSRDGRHHRLLRALRHLEDPALRPLFEQLCHADHPALRIHGVLALAETGQPPRIDLERVQDEPDPLAQAELVSAALRHGLMDLDQTQTLLEDKGLDLGVVLVLAKWLIPEGRFDDADRLRGALDSAALARRGMAGLLLWQLRQEEGAQALEEVNRSAAPERDVVREMLLDAAIAHHLDRAAEWAYRIAREPGLPSRLGRLALRAAMQFDHPDALADWQQRVLRTDDSARHVRLGVVGLEVASHIGAEGFAPLLEASHPLVREIAQAGQAIARPESNPTDRIGRLLERRHPALSDWAIEHAREEASPSAGTRILMDVLDCTAEAIEQADPPEPARQLTQAMRATEALLETAPAAGGLRLRRQLQAEDGDERLKQAVLLGLIQSRGEAASRVLRPIESWPSPTARRLAVVLAGREGESLSQQQEEELALIVRGGGGLEDTIRLQAAWAWLKREDRLDGALARVLDPE